ncbi:hypothetical protein RhiTH_004126 [Rhizoctonia solani]
MNAGVRVTEDKYHASATGGINSAFGLSAFFFSTLARELFPGRTGAFLTVLCLGTGSAVLLGAILVRPPPLGPIRLETEEDGENQEREEESEREEERRPFWTEHTPLRTGTVDESILYGEQNPWASQAATPNASGAATPNTNGSRIDKVEDVHGIALFTSLDFLIIFGIVGLLGGPGLMYINNVGSIVQALFASAGEGWSRREAEKAQASQVGIISVCSFVGRFVIGFLADHLSHNHTIPRTSCLLLSATIGIVAISLLLNVTDVILERFGMPHFAQNAGLMGIAAKKALFGNVYNYTFGRNFDNHSQPAFLEPVEPVEPAGEGLICLEGRGCYIASGEFHPWRLPSTAPWRDVLEKMKPAGFDAVFIYFHWRLSESKRANLNFEGYLSVTRFLEIAKDVGILVIVRPGPYINAETTGGGYPGWLTNVPDTGRSNGSDFTPAWKPYIRAVSEYTAPYQYPDGSVILVQSENEYSVDNPSFANVFYKNNYAAGTYLQNLCMTYGGTNWGNLATPTVYTSYDYATPVSEDRSFTAKYSEIKLQALFLHATPHYHLASRISTDATHASLNCIWTTHLATTKGQNLYIIRQTSTTRTGRAEFDFKVNTTAGEVVLHSVALNGRERKIVVSEYPFGNSSVLVFGPYLARNATINGSTLDITGDAQSATTTKLEVLAPSVIEHVTFDGQPVTVSKSTTGTLKGSIRVKDLAPKLPNLLKDAEWKCTDSLPEVALDFDDSEWITANKTLTLRPARFRPLAGKTAPRGIRGYELIGDRGDFSSWKLAGTVDGEDTRDTLRGPMNQRELYTERIGAIYTNYSTTSWNSTGCSPSAGITLDRAGTTAYKTKLTLDIDKHADVPLAFRFERTLGKSYRVMVYVNEWQFGKFVSNFGPQTVYPVPEGILDRRGENNVVLVLWSLDGAGAKVANVELIATNVLFSSKEVINGLVN